MYLRFIVYVFFFPLFVILLSYVSSTFILFSIVISGPYILIYIYIYVSLNMKHTLYSVFSLIPSFAISVPHSLSLTLSHSHSSKYRLVWTRYEQFHLFYPQGIHNNLDIDLRHLCCHHQELIIILHILLSVDLITGRFEEFVVSQ